MSITALEMIADALRLVNVIDEVKAPSAEQAVNGLRTLNQLMADWEKDGIRLGWHVVASTNDTLPLEASDELMRSLIGIEAPQNRPRRESESEEEIRRAAE